MKKIFFITATDTEASKTYVSEGLLKLANARHLTSIGLKPVASGCHLENKKLYNSDALILQKTASRFLSYEAVNPFAFLPPIAPHIAAQHEQVTLNVNSLILRTQATLNEDFDIAIIEGFGGWHAPLNNHETMADFAVQLKCKVIMVVGMRVGCINHAILTQRSIQESGAICVGWIANLINPHMPYLTECIAALQNWVNAPMLASIKHGEIAEHALQALTLF